MSTVTMREMLEAGVHFGHQTRYWNPQMAPYLFGQRNKIHIINLETTLPLFNDAINFAGKLASKKAKILFVGTKRAAQKILEEEAQRCAMPYVNKRWLGGLLTNFKTVKQSINRLKLLEEMFSSGSIERMSKKETQGLNRELQKLKQSLGGIKEMPILPDALFIIDVGFEDIAVSEAVKLNIPVIGVVDSNNSPKGVDYIIPGNDDAIRSIRLYARIMADAIRDGRSSVAHLPDDQAADDFVELDESGTPVVDDKVRKSKTQTRKKMTRRKAAMPEALGEDDAAVKTRVLDSATDSVDAVDGEKALKTKAAESGRKLVRKKVARKTTAVAGTDRAKTPTKENTQG